MNKELMMMALEALNVMRPACFADTTLKTADTAINALRQALEQPADEPVAEVTSETGAEITMSWWHEPALPLGTKLYTRPQPADEFPFARSLSDELMDCVDRLGSEYDTVDPRVWDHLLVYAPKKPAAQCEYIQHTKEGTHWCALAEKTAAWVGLTDEEIKQICWESGPVAKQHAALRAALAWVGLTDEDMQELAAEQHSWERLCSAVEAKLKEKNNA